MLRGKLVYLRPFEKRDLESLFNAIHDDEIRYMTGTRNTSTMEQLNKYFERMDNDDTRRDFAICLCDSEEIAGDLTIMDIDSFNHKAGFRIALHDRNHMNKGYGTEAVKLALRYVFEELKLNRLQLEVYSHNSRGIKSYEKAGFKQEGVIRQSLYYNDQYSDEIIMGMLKEDYDKLVSE